MTNLTSNQRNGTFIFTGVEHHTEGEIDGHQKEERGDSQMGMGSDVLWREH
jgi:hypothetical protein